MNCPRIFGLNVISKQDLKKNNISLNKPFAKVFVKSYFYEPKPYNILFILVF
jgi:hypothetical protein